MLNNFIFFFILKITVTPLAGLSRADVDSQTYFEDWLQSVPKHLSSAAL